MIIRKIVREWILPIGLAFVIALLFRVEVAQAMYIPSGSMEPTLQINDVVFISKRYQKIERGDIVVFLTPKMYDGEEHLIKRVIGLPGEELLIKDGKLRINGQYLPEQYIKEIPKADYGPILIPEGEYFLMGDNRNNSTDSRYIGTITSEQINGKFILRIPTSKIFEKIRN